MQHTALPCCLPLPPPLQVRELWYRASLAWQQVLAGAQGPGCSLVVAHNAGTLRCSSFPGSAWLCDVGMLLLGLLISPSDFCC